MTDVGAVSGDEPLAIRRGKLIADLESLGFVPSWEIDRFSPGLIYWHWRLADDVIVVVVPTDACFEERWLPQAARWFAAADTKLAPLLAIRDRAKAEERERCAGVVESQEPLSRRLDAHGERYELIVKDETAAAIRG